MRVDHIFSVKNYEVHALISLKACLIILKEEY